MAATYNDDGTVNVMNLHEVTRTNAGIETVLASIKGGTPPIDKNSMDLSDEVNAKYWNDEMTDVKKLKCKNNNAESF